MHPSRGKHLSARCRSNRGVRECWLCLAPVSAQLDLRRANSRPRGMRMINPTIAVGASATRRTPGSDRSSPCPLTVHTHHGAGLLAEIYLLKLEARCGRLGAATPLRPRGFVPSPYRRQGVLPPFLAPSTICPPQLGAPPPRQPGNATTTKSGQPPGRL